MSSIVDRAPAPPPAHALRAYERCAPYYDLLTADYDHGGWLATIDQLAAEHGLVERSALDVACGTGKSTAPLVGHGYDVWACDLSPAMVRRARMRLGTSARVFVADMRALRCERTFGLVTCLDDALNYLLSDAEVRDAMNSFATALRPGGLAIFDVNTTATYAAAFGAGCEASTAAGRLRWRGRGQGPDGTFSAIVEPVRAGGGLGRPSLHIQRHHPPEVVRAACRDAGLDVVRIYGQSSGGRLDEDFDESRHSKLLYVVRRPARGGAR
jgi:SAM-dependent methyltransferase